MCARVFLLLIISLACSVGAVATESPPAGQLWIGVEGANPPFQFIDRDRRLKGLEIEIVTEICQRLARPCLFRITQWEDLRPSLAEKRVDVLASSLEISRRKLERFRYTRPIYLIPWVYVGRVDSKLAPAPDADLAGLTVAVEREGPSANYLARFLPKAKVVTMANRVEALLELAAERVDLVLMRRDHATRWLNDTPEGACCRVKAVLAPNPMLTGRGVGLVVRGADKALADAIDGAIDTMRNDGTMERLVYRWLLFSLM